MTQVAVHAPPKSGDFDRKKNTSLLKVCSHKQRLRTLKKYIHKNSGKLAHIN